MTVLQQVALASTVIGVPTPTILFGATDPTSLALQNCVNRAAQMIAYDSDHDWSYLKAVATITGNAVTTQWPLPADYQKMIKKADLWSSKTPNTPITHYIDSNRFLGLQVQAFLPVFGAWTIIGGKLNIIPARATAEVVSFLYMKNTPVLDAGATAKALFTADTDTFPLGERLLQLALIYLWKQDKGQDFGEAMEDYQTVLATSIGTDRGSTRMVVGKQRLQSGSSGVTAFPRSLGS